MFSAVFTDEDVTELENVDRILSIRIMDKSKLIDEIKISEEIRESCPKNEGK